MAIVENDRFIAVSGSQCGQIDGDNSFEACYDVVSFGWNRSWINAVADDRSDRIFTPGFDPINEARGAVILFPVEN